MKTISDNANSELLAAAKLAFNLIKNTWVVEHGNPQVGEAWGALELAIFNAIAN
jgi:hypothetical protein